MPRVFEPDVDRRDRIVTSFVHMIQRLRVRDQNRSRWSRIFSRITHRLVDSKTVDTVLKQREAFTQVVPGLRDYAFKIYGINRDLNLRETFSELVSKFFESFTSKNENSKSLKQTEIKSNSQTKTTLQYQISNYKLMTRCLQNLPSIRDLRYMIKELGPENKCVFKISIIKICLDMHEAFNQFEHDFRKISKIINLQCKLIKKAMNLIDIEDMINYMNEVVKKESYNKNCVALYYALNLCFPDTENDFSKYSNKIDSIKSILENITSNKLYE